MKQELIELLETLGYPVFLQGSLNSEKDYPNNFFTFWNYDNPEQSYYDNSPNSCQYGFWIYFYSDNPRLVESESEKARQLLKSNGWSSSSKPTDIKVDKPTHTGAIFAVIKKETYEEEI